MPDYTISHAEIVSTFRYDASTRRFFLRETDTPLGWLNPKGYVYIREYRAHRLAWFYVYGEWPKGQVDHINGIRQDNRISNLRLANSAEQNQNRGKRNDNASGFIGVSWRKKDKRWRAQIGVGGKKIHLGNFDTPEAANDAYCQAKAELHQFNPVLLRA